MSEPVNLRTRDFIFEDAAPKGAKVVLFAKEYVLRESSEATAAAYRNYCMRAAKFSSEGKVSGMDGIGEVSAILVGNCLFAVVDGKPINDPVGQQFVLSLPSRIVKPLFEWVKRESALDENEADKNVSTQTAKN